MKILVSFRTPCIADLQFNRVSYLNAVFLTPLGDNSKQHNCLSFINSNKFLSYKNH